MLCLRTLCYLCRTFQVKLKPWQKKNQNCWALQDLMHKLAVSISISSNYFLFLKAQKYVIRPISFFKLPYTLPISNWEEAMLALLGSTRKLCPFCCNFLLWKKECHMCCHIYLSLNTSFWRKVSLLYHKIPCFTLSVLTQLTFIALHVMCP